MFQYIKAAHFC